MESYETLRDKKNALKKQLDNTEDIKHHPTWKAVRREYDETVKKIKTIFHK